MTVKEALYSRGKVAGVYPALPTRKDEAYIEFIEDARNILMHAQQRPISEYSRKLMTEAGIGMSPDNAKWLNATQAAEVEALGLGDHVVADMHVGAGGGVVVAQTLFKTFPGKTMVSLRFPSVLVD